VHHLLVIVVRVLHVLI